MIVRLSNGEESEAKAEDLAKFGYADRDRTISDWRTFVEDATGRDMIEGSDLAPYWTAMHQSVHRPAALTDGALDDTRRDISRIAAELRGYGPPAGATTSPAVSPTPGSQRRKPRPASRGFLRPWSGHVEWQATECRETLASRGPVHRGILFHFLVSHAQSQPNKVSRANKE